MNPVLNWEGDWFQSVRNLSYKKWLDSLWHISQFQTFFFFFLFTAEYNFSGLIDMNVKTLYGLAPPCHTHTLFS